MPPIDNVNINWAINGYDQFKDEEGSWVATFLFMISEGMLDLFFLTFWIAPGILPINAECDLNKYPEQKPGIKLWLNKTYLFGENSEDFDQETLDSANEILKEVLDKIDFIDEEGNVDTDKMYLECTVEGEDEDEDEEEDDTSFPLLHYMNKIGLALHKHLG